MKTPLRANDLHVSKTAEEEETDEEEGGGERLTLGPDGQYHHPQERKKDGEQEKRITLHQGTGQHAGPIRQD